MKAATLKRSPQPAADREALVQALADLAEARKAVERHNTATHRYWAALREREAAVKQAEKGIEDAKAEHGRVLANSATADQDDPPDAGDMVRLARQSLQDARDALEATQAARDAIKLDLPDLETDLRFAVANVRAEAARILVPHMQALLSKAQEAWKVLEPLKRLLELAVIEERSVDGTWQGIAAAGRVAKPLETLRAEIGEFLHECSNRVYRVDGPPNPFHAALLALEQNPDADISEFVTPASRPPPAA